MSGPYSLEDLIGYWPTVIVAWLLGICGLLLVGGIAYGGWRLFVFLVKCAIAQ